MSDTSVPTTALLREAAQRLRDADHLGPEAQKELAELIGRFADALQSPNTPAEEAGRLSQSAHELIQALHPRQETGLLAAAKGRLEQAIIAAETEAPLATGLATQLLNVLANLGI